MIGDSAHFNQQKRPLSENEFPPNGLFSQLPLIDQSLFAINDQWAAVCNLVVNSIRCRGTVVIDDVAALSAAATDQTMFLARGNGYPASGWASST